jgi:hypothetical protein
MTQEIIEMARQAGCFEKHQVFYFTSQDLEAFAKLVAEREREACLKIVGDKAWHYATPTWATAVANAIRERKQA